MKKVLYICKKLIKTMSENINLDKFYTPKETVNKCLDIFFSMINIDEITEIIEPSAGNGAFSLQIPNCISYDILPEHESIKKTRLP